MRKCSLIRLANQICFALRLKLNRRLNGLFLFAFYHTMVVYTIHDNIKGLGTSWLVEGKKVCFGSPRGHCQPICHTASVSTLMKPRYDVVCCLPVYNTLVTAVTKGNETEDTGRTTCYGNVDEGAVLSDLWDMEKHLRGVGVWVDKWDL